MRAQTKKPIPYAEKKAPKGTEDKGIGKPKEIKPLPTVQASDLFFWKDENGKKWKLTFKEKAFCEAYLELYGNGTDAVIEAGYNCTNSRGDINRGLAATISKENLIKPHIFGYISSLLAKFGYADKNIEKQHLFLINQFGDLSAKAKGLDMFYKVKGLYPKDQAITDALRKYQNMPDAELNRIIDGEVIKDDE